MISIAFFLSKLLHNACCEKKPSKKSKNQFVLGYWLSGRVPFMTRYCLQSCYKMLQQKRITKLIQQKSDMCSFQGWSSEATDILPTKIRFLFPFCKKNSATNNQWNILLKASDSHECDCESKWGFTLLYWVCTPMCPPPPACSLKSLTWREGGTLPELLEGEGCWKCCFFSAADAEAEVEEGEDDGTPVLLLRRSASCLIACSSSESISSMLKPQQSASIACFLQTEKNPPAVIPTLATCNKLQESPPSHGVTQIHIPALLPKFTFLPHCLCAGIAVPNLEQNFRIHSSTPSHAAAADHMNRLYVTLMLLATLLACRSLMHIYTTSKFFFHYKNSSEALFWVPHCAISILNRTDDRESQNPRLFFLSAANPALERCQHAT